jgi:hypothetical protein
MWNNITDEDIERADSEFGVGGEPPDAMPFAGRPEAVEGAAEFEQSIGDSAIIKNKDEDIWLSTEEGSHFLLGESGKIKAGFGGKFTGKKPGEVWGGGKQQSETAKAKPKPAPKPVAAPTVTPVPKPVAAPSVKAKPKPDPKPAAAPTAVPSTEANKAASSAPAKTIQEAAERAAKVGANVNYDGFDLGTAATVTTALEETAAKFPKLKMPEVATYQNCKEILTASKLKELDSDPECAWMSDDNKLRIAKRYAENRYAAYQSEYSNAYALCHNSDVFINDKHAKDTKGFNASLAANKKNK